ncbi:50S ribosomal protein L3 [Candidatus Micrarchaeota archaeon CG1_02_47_40]|nr:MAG: 50S ribosomal protein L3 [Candidatus Micrarchaeota archaeon CG1_02_47_40]
MGKRNKHRKSSLAFKPRKRANSQRCRINFWPKLEEKRLLGFAGYKAGMTHITYIDDSESPSKGLEVSYPVTILEAPPMNVFGIRFYKDKKVLCDVLCPDEKILSPLGMKKKKNIEIPSSFDDVFVLVYLQSKFAGLPKKTPEPMEIALGGKDEKEKLEYAQSILGKELKAPDVFKTGEYVDEIGVSKGHGLQGAVKRHGISLQRRKATGKKRHVGTLGPWHPSYVMYTVPMAGQHGYHKRTQLNARIMKIGEGKEINPKSGFRDYGIVKTNYLMLGGSVAGPAKRLVRMRIASRKPGVLKAPQIISVRI